MSAQDSSMAMIKQILDQLEEIRKDNRRLIDENLALQKQVIELSNRPVQTQPIQSLANLKPQIDNAEARELKPSTEKRITDVADTILLFAKQVSFK